MKPRLSKVCVILGAGASYDVHNDDSLVLDRTLQPPLARDLFNYADNPNYHDILQAYPGAVVLAQSLASKASSREFDLEAELRRLAEHPSDQIKEHFKHIPPYLRDLLQRASTGYVTEPSCYIQLVVELLAESPHEVMFLVLNYDTLLEDAVVRFNSSWQFSAIGDYVRNDGRPKVVKLHGSVNWFKNIGAIETLGGWEDRVREGDVLSKPPENEIEVLSPHDGSVKQPVADLIIGRNRVYPVLTAPLAGKGVADAVCPESHIDLLAEFLATCSKFLIIGTSGLDEDLLLLLDSAIPPESRPFVRWVDQSNARQVLARFTTGVRAFKRRATTDAEKFGREQPFFNGGFKNYVTQGELQKFAKIAYEG